MKYGANIKKKAFRDQKQCDLFMRIGGRTSPMGTKLCIRGHKNQEYSISSKVWKHRKK